MLPFSRNDLPTERLPTTAILRCFGVGIWARLLPFLGWEETVHQIGKQLVGKDTLSTRDSNSTAMMVVQAQKNAIQT